MEYSNNIALRALEPEDLELVHTIENDSSLWAWGALSQPISHYTVRQYLAQQHSDIYQDGQLRLVITCDGKPVGIIDLTDFSPPHLRAEVGIVLLPSFHRKGIATEALHQIALYATEHLHLATLYAYVAENNTAAQALFRRAGYTTAANLPNWIEGRHSATLFLLHL